MPPGRKAREAFLRINTKWLRRFVEKSFALRKVFFPRTR